MKIEDKNKKSTALVEVEAEVTHLTPSERILTPLELSDYSQFLYETNYGGIKGQDFTAEGIKTLGLHNSSTGDTSSVVIQQNRNEHGRDNPNWITKGSARAIRNAIKARLPVQLFKTTLRKASEVGNIVEIQRQLSVAWTQRGDCLCNINKRQFFLAAQVEYGDCKYWDVDTWQQLLTDLTTLADWVKGVK